MNPYKEAAQSMMQAGIGSLSGNTINKPPLSTPKENYIRETHDLNSPTNVINRKIQDFNNLKKSYEGTGIVPQTFPDWVTQDPDASGMMNTWGRYNKGSMFGTPMCMEAGITNPNLKQLAGLDDVWPWMKDKAWPWMKETGKGMKNQIPYFLDNMVPFYEPPEGYYDPDWEENKDMADLNLQEVMDLYESLGLDLNTDRFIRKANKAGVQVAGMDDSLQYLQRQIDELDRDSPNYDDQLEMLINDMEMKYPWAIS